jgi:hypothetical protein
MNRRIRLTVLVVLAALVVAAPTVLIALRADRGSAAFGDEERMGRNRIASATVDIAVGEHSVPITASGIAPGDLTAGAAEFFNAGSVPLVYAVTARASVGELAPYLTWWFSIAEHGSICPTASEWERQPPANRIELDGRALAGDGALPLVGNAASGRDPGDRMLDLGEADLLCVAVALAVDAPNGVQDTTTAIEFVAHAEQATGALATSETVTP